MRILNNMNVQCPLRRLWRENRPHPASRLQLQELMFASQTTRMTLDRGDVPDARGCNNRDILHKHSMYSLVLLFAILFQVIFMEQPKALGAVSSEHVKLEGLGPEIPSQITIVIKEILAEANIEKARATSLRRTMRQQTEEMLKLAEASVAKAKVLYCKAGDAVIDVYVQNKSKSRSQVLRLMEAELERQLPTAQDAGCLNHIESSRYIAVDIAKSSIPEGKLNTFKKAVRARREISGFLCPPTDPNAYHLEFPRNEKEHGKGLVRDFCR